MFISMSAFLVGICTSLLLMFAVPLLHLLSCAVRDCQVSQWAPTLLPRTGL